MARLNNGKLSLNKFVVQLVLADGTWERTGDLFSDYFYRFVLEFRNTWRTSDNVFYSGIHYTVRRYPRVSGPKWIRYYTSEAFTGTPRNQIDKYVNVNIQPQQTHQEYVHFRWLGPEAYQIGNIDPGVRFRGREVVTTWQKNIGSTLLVPTSG